MTMIPSPGISSRSIFSPGTPSPSIRTSGIAAAGVSSPGPNGPAAPTVAKTASDFEAMAIDQFLQPMFASDDEGSGLFDGGQAEATLKPMLITEFAKLMEQKGGLGLVKPIEAKLEQLQQAKDLAR